MNIVLTQKDADFILSYIRADVERQNTRCDVVNEKEKELRQLMSELGDNPFTKIFSDILNNSSEQFHALYKKQTDLAIKCIELLTIGSADV